MALCIHLLSHQGACHGLQAVPLLQDLPRRLDRTAQLSPVLRVDVHDAGTVNDVLLRLVRVRNELIAARLLVAAANQQFNVLQLLAVVAVVILLASDYDLRLGQGLIRTLRSSLVCLLTGGLGLFGALMAAPISMSSLLRFRIGADGGQVLHVVVRAGGEDVLAQRVQEVQRLGVHPGRWDTARHVKLKAEHMLNFILG